MHTPALSQHLLIGLWHARNMAKQTSDDLARARAELHDKNIITLLGEPDAGKTVASALLKHALFNKFIPMHGGRFQAMVSKGGTEIEDVLKGMKVGCIFPPATTRVDAPQVELEIHKMDGKGAGESKLMLQDSSGENYMALLRQEFDDPKQRLEAILAYNNENGNVGSLAPYVFSKVYLLVIECPSDSSHWDMHHSSSTIFALRQVHEEAQLTHNGKVRTHIAILFTKSDTLADTDRNRPASEFLERMPELKSALEIVHGGDLECFKLSVEVEKESPEDVSRRVSRLQQRAQDNLEREQIKYKEKLNAFVAENAARARKEKASEYGKAALEQHVKDVKSRAEQRFCALNKAPVLEFDEDKENKLKHKVKAGFKYSQDEYVRLIEWIIARLYD